MVTLITGAGQVETEPAHRTSLVSKLKLPGVVGFWVRISCCTPVMVVPDAPKWFTPAPFQLVKTAEPISTSTPVTVMASTRSHTTSKLNPANKLKAFATVFIVSLLVGYSPRRTKPIIAEISSKSKSAKACFLCRILSALTIGNVITKDRALGQFCDLGVRADWTAMSE